MSNIDITRQHQLSPAKAREVIEHIAASLQKKFGVTPRWEGDSLHFTRSGVNGFIALGDSQVHVNATLGMLLTPLKPTVEAEIQRKLDQYFPVAKD